MQVILLQSVRKLGKVGDSVEVKQGFALNYLFPQSIAIRATAENIKSVETQKAQLEAANQQKIAAASTLAEKIAGTTVTIIKAASEAKRLYGSVGTKEIAKELEAKGFNINQSQVIIEHPIRELGIFNVKLALHSEVMVDISVNVAQSNEEAENQKLALLRHPKDDFGGQAASSL